MKKDPRITFLLHEIERAFDKPSWHGPNLMGSLRGIGPAEAAWRPGPERHNIWELVVHAAYWKYRVRRMLTDEPPRSFGVPGSNFFPRPPTEAPGETEAAWEADLDLLRSWHGRLLDALVAFDPGRLSEKPGKKVYTFEVLISGMAAHDVYHAGQIGLLKRLGGFS
jgi:DinB superfamily